MVVRYRMIRLQTSSLRRDVEFEGSLEALKLRFPLELFPTPIQKRIEDVSGGWGGSVIFMLQQAKMADQNDEPSWEPVIQDPRL